MNKTPDYQQQLNTDLRSAIDSHNVDILVVEDYKHSHNIFRNVFRKEFARVFITTKTDEGLEIIKNDLKSGSVVLSDHENPISPYYGVELAELSAPDRAAKDIPFYLMSARQLLDIEGANSLIDQGTINGFINKPFNSISELRNLVLSSYKKVRP